MDFKGLVTVPAIDLTPILFVVGAGALGVGLVRLAIVYAQRHARDRTRRILKASEATSPEPPAA